MRLATVVSEGARFPRLVASLTVDGQEWLVDLTQAYAAYLFVVEGEQFADDLAQARLQGDMLRMLRGGERSLQAARQTVDYAAEQLADPRKRAAWQAAAMLWPVERVRFLPPVLRPGKAVNSASKYPVYSDEHAVSPRLLSRTYQGQVGHNEQVVRPRHTTQLDVEAELAVVIGKRCKDVREEDALDVVIGFTCYGDLTMRDVSAEELEFGGGLTFSRCFDTSSPVGPYLVTKDEVPDPQSLEVVLRVNGTVWQRDNTKNMPFSIAQCIVSASRQTLEPGDLVSSAIPDVARVEKRSPVFLEGGDVVEVEIERVGLLRNTIVDEASTGAGPYSAGVFAGPPLSRPRR